MSKLQSSKKMVSSVLAAGVFALAAAVTITGEAGATDLATVQAEADTLEEQLVALLEDAKDLPDAGPGNAVPADPGNALPADAGKAPPGGNGSAEPAADGTAKPGVDGSVQPGADKSVAPAADQNVQSGVDGSVAPGVDANVTPVQDVNAPPAADVNVQPGAVAGNVQPGPVAGNEPVVEAGTEQAAPSGEVEQVGDVQAQTEADVPLAKAGQEVKQAETGLAYTGSNGMVPTGLAGLGLLALGIVMVRHGRPAVSRN